MIEAALTAPDICHKSLHASKVPCYSIIRLKNQDNTLYDNELFRHKESTTLRGARMTLEDNSIT